MRLRRRRRHVVVRGDHPSLALVDDEHLLDALVFGCGPAVVDRVEPADASTRGGGGGEARGAARALRC